MTDLLTEDDRSLINALQKHGCGSGPGFVLRLVAIIEKLEAELRRRGSPSLP